MLYTKMISLMDEVSSHTAEREELVTYIALALLSKKNLFILGDTGQAKSYCINEFRKRITGTKQFEHLMSKQTDEEQIFGRLDLSSLIPGNMPSGDLMKENSFAALRETLSGLYEKYCSDGLQGTLKEATEKAKELEIVRRIICALKSGSPKMITDGKIPDSHIVFLDEIFKSGDGILNSLLTALNERVYTNEGQTVPIPVISFFSASNEIPDFNDSTQAILKPLYDRFELKVLTRYVEEKENRLKILKDKQAGANSGITETISLAELEQMQNEVSGIAIPDSINELMDSVLCELRKAGVHVSDRKFFGFSPIVRANAFLRGSKTVSPQDLIVLKNYFWNTPDEIHTIENILVSMCENPMRAKVEKLLEMAYEGQNQMLADMPEGSEDIRAYVKFIKELMKIYVKMTELKNPDISESDEEQINAGLTELEDICTVSDEYAKTPHVPLSERQRLNV